MSHTTHVLSLLSHKWTLFWVKASSLPLVSIVYRFDDDGQEDLSGCGVYVDPEYNILWSYSPKDNLL